MKISILGARGQIARSLISLYIEKSELSGLALYSRDPEKLRLEIKDAVVYSSEDFPRHNHDVIINCIGIPTVKGVPNRASDVFDIHERWDNLILQYLNRNQKALYISMSSGAVYGRNFQNPVDETCCLLQGITEISPADFYGVSKLNCEAKHRAHEKFSIVDLRIFSYISRFIDFNSNFLVSEILTALRNKKIFMTNDHNIARDYLHPEDMMQILSLIIKRWQKTGFINDVFDVYSKKPITKMDLLESLAKKFNLQYEIKKELHVDASATGFKMNYYSVNKKLEKIGYEPRYSSLNAILKVFGEVL